MRLTTTRSSLTGAGQTRGRRGSAGVFAVAAVLVLGLTAPAVAAADESAPAAPAAGDVAVVGSDDALPATPGGPALEAEAASEGAEDVVVAVVEQPDGSLKVETHETGSEAAAQHVARELGKAPNVVASGVDHRVIALAAPNDEFFACQWALQSGPAKCDPNRDGVDDITGKKTRYTAPFAFKAQSVWTKSTGSGVVVAVVDSGVKAAHEDLTGAVLDGTDFVKAGTKGHLDQAGHGTHVAGIIAAHANNVSGVAGLAPGAKILPVRVLDASGEGWDSDVANGIIWAVDNGADVINLSLGGDQRSAVQQSAINYAIARGVLVVAAAGNFGQEGNPTFYPAALPGVLAVGASTLLGNHAPFSERRPYVAVAAPGVDIASTYINCSGAPVNGCYSFDSGTSMASPFVAATAALLLEKNPELSPAALSAYIAGTTTDDGPTGRDVYFGFGHLNPGKAVDGVISGVARPTSIAFKPASSTVLFGAETTLKVFLTSRGYRLPRRPVTFERRSSTGAWEPVASTYTNFSGEAKLTVRINKHEQYRAIAAAIPGLARAATITSVTAVAKVYRSGSSPRAGRVTVTAQAYPKLQTTMRLQRKIDGKWTTRATKLSTSDGRVTFTNVNAPSGTRYFRVVSSATPGVGGGTSATLTIKVK